MRVWVSFKLIFLSTCILLQMVFSSKQPVDILLCSKTTRWLWNKPSLLFVWTEEWKITNKCRNFLVRNRLPINIWNFKASPRFHKRCKKLKPMDSFGTWQKWKLIYIFFNAKFYRVALTIDALLTVRSEMLPFSGNNPKHNNVRSPPEHFAIRYVHNDNLPLGNIALQYVIQNNCSKVWLCFLMISCTFWIVEFTKTILWL